MEALTVLLIGVTSTLGIIALGVGGFVLAPGRRNKAAWYRVPSPHQGAGARVVLGQH